jgi:hypothetical protein
LFVERPDLLPLGVPGPDVSRDRQLQDGERDLQSQALVESFPGRRS